MKLPKISIIVPVYNTEKKLSHCIDSILKQTFTDFELLLIDDGSTDRSGEICDVYADKDNRIHIFHKNNGGVSSARNWGLNKACGEWITFVDSDDWIGTNFLSELLTGYGDLIVGGKTNTGYRNDIKIYKSKIYQKECIGECLTATLSDDIFRAPWGKLFKKEIINNNNLRFDIHMKIGEDTAFVQSYLYHCNVIQFINSSSYFYYCQYSSKYKLSSEEFYYNQQKLINTYVRLSEKFHFTNESYIIQINNIFTVLYLKWIISQKISYKFYKDLKNTLQKSHTYPILDINNYPKSIIIAIRILANHHYIIGYLFIRIGMPLLNKIKKATKRIKIQISYLP